jgi:hypothetical protein
MPKMQHRLGLGIGAALIAGGLCAAPASRVFAETSAPADAQSSAHARAPCFFRREWKGGWKTTPDARTMYIRVSRSIYRLDLQASYPLLRDPWAVLGNKDSADTICGPLDFRLTVSNQAGIKQWPLVKRMTRLSPAEAAALPKKLRP